MMNGGHAASGALTGTAAVCLLQTLEWAPVSTATYLWGAIGLGAASALLPDIDCDGSAMYRSVPPLTPALGEMLQWCSRTLYRATAREHDPSPYRNQQSKGLTGWRKFLAVSGVTHLDDKRGEHRGLTHWWGFALLTGALVSLLLALIPVAAVLVVGALLPAGVRALVGALADLLRPLGARIRTPGRLTAFGASLLLIVLFGADIVTAGPWIGALIAVGMITHDVGDSLTRRGVPWKALIPHRCDRCRARRPKPARRCAMWDCNTLLPGWLTFATGSPVELALTAVFFALTAGMQILLWT